MEMPSTGPRNKLGTGLPTVRRDSGAMFRSCRYSSPRIKSGADQNAQKDKWRLVNETPTARRRAAAENCSAVLDSIMLV